MVYLSPYYVLTHNCIYDTIQYDCLKTASLFFFQLWHFISFIPDDGLRINRNVE